MTYKVRIGDWRYFYGSSWWSREPCVQGTLAFDELSDFSATQIQNAVAGLGAFHSTLSWLPVLPAHHSPSLVYANAVAAVAHYLLNAVRGHIKTQSCVPTNKANQFLIVVGAHEHTVTKAAIELSFELIAYALSRPEPERIELLRERLDHFWLVCRQNHPDFQARILMLGADKRGLSYSKSAAGDRIWQYGSGNAALMSMETNSTLDSAIYVAISRNKLKTNQWLALCGFPVPRQWLVGTSEDLDKVWRARTTELVIKPLDRGQGRGVTVGPKTYSDALTAFESAKDQTHLAAVLVEEFVPGDDYRILVIGGKVLAVTRRRPPEIIGNGTSTVAELVGYLNTMRNNDSICRRYLQSITPTHDVMSYLQQQNLGWNSVLQSGQRVQLRGNANVSTGGTPLDVTDTTHQSVVKTAEQIAKQFGIYAIGIDYITVDISLSPTESGGRFIEINTTPGLDLHVASGFSEVDLGDRFLPKNLKDIAISVYIASGTDLQNKLDTDLDRFIKDGFFVSVSNFLILQDRSKLVFDHQLAAVKCALSRADCSQLLVLCDTRYFELYGLPVCFASEIILGRLDDSLSQKVQLAADKLNAKIVLEF